jgi:hypothetical protein
MEFYDKIKTASKNYFGKLKGIAEGAIEYGKGFLEITAPYKCMMEVLNRPQFFKDLGNVAMKEGNEFITLGKKINAVNRKYTPNTNISNAKRPGKFSLESLLA